MKRVISLFVFFVLLLTPLSAAAASPRIIDDAGLLTSQQITLLEEKADYLVNKYQMDVVIVTVWSLGGKTSEEYADDYYDYNGYGIGERFSGVLLLLSMEYRDWAISTCGETIYALTDYNIQSLFSQISSYLAQDAYYEAFDAYLDALEPYFQAYSEGDPMDGYRDPYAGPGSFETGTKDDVVFYEETRDLFWYAKRLLIGLAVGVVVALIVLLIMRTQMKTAKIQHGAANYIERDSYCLTRHMDIFLYSQVRKIPRSDGSSGGSRGGGSSVHRSSSGRSHGGGHGKF